MNIRGCICVFAHKEVNIFALVGSLLKPGSPYLHSLTVNRCIRHGFQ